MRACEIKVVVEYQFDGINYEALSYVTINHKYEVEEVRISIVEAFKDDMQVPFTLDESLKANLEAVSASKALEKVQEEDFSSESERE